MADALTPGGVVGILMVMATFGVFLSNRDSATGGDDEDVDYASGFFYSTCALFGNAGTGALRKLLAAKKVGHAEQVGFAVLLQGVAQIAYLAYMGMLAFPGLNFWVAAVGSSVLGALVKTLETKAFAESDMSLCAPFLAFDPVMQFVVGVGVLPHTCGMFEFGCDEMKTSFPTHHIMSVVCIAAGAFLLGQAAKGKEKTDDKSSKVQYLGPLPIGSWFILGNCVIYGFTSRMDKVAVKAGGKVLYNGYNRLLMAATTLGGATIAGKLNTKSAAAFLKPDVALLLLGICAAETFYMINLYQAMVTISPVYVTAIKRGGGVLVSSLAGIVLFGENLEGRTLPIAIIVAAVVMLVM